MRAASPPRSRRTHRGLKPRCAAPLLLFAAWLGGCTAADPPGWDITVSGGCSWATGSSGPRTYTYQGTTDSDAPYYKADGSSWWLYWDPDCDGSGGSSRPARWIFDNSAPNTTASSDLDGDGMCAYTSRIDSIDSTSPPQGLKTWRSVCEGSWKYTEITILQLAPPPPLGRVLSHLQRVRPWSEDLFVK